MTEHVEDGHPRVQVGQSPPLAGARVEALEDVGAVLHPPAGEDDVWGAPGQDRTGLSNTSYWRGQPGPGEAGRGRDIPEPHSQDVDDDVVKAELPSPKLD